MAEAARRSGVSVIVPTTDQPIIVKKLTWSAQLPVSRVVLGNSEPCEGWTKQYAHVLAEGEPFRAFLRLPESGSYRLVVTAPVDQGKSWMVPVAAAHAAIARNEAIVAKIADARLLVWGTGAIDLAVADRSEEAKIQSQDYHLNTKLDRSRHLFAEAAHGQTPVLALIPAGEEAERAAAILAKVLGKQPHHIAIVSSLADVTGPVERFLSSGVFVAPPPANALEPYRAPEESPPDPAAARPPEPPGAAPAAPEPEAPVAPADPAMATAAATGSSASQRRALTGGWKAPRLDLRGRWTLPAGIVALVVVAAGVGYFAARRPVGPEPVTTAPSLGTQPAGQKPVAQPGPIVAPPSIIAAPALARLVTLVPPAGSSCERQFYEANPRYSRNASEVPEGASSIEVQGDEICGVELERGSATRLRFQPGTGPAPVASRSNPTRVMFNPTAMRGAPVALPSIEIQEPKPQIVEVRRR